MLTLESRVLQTIRLEKMIDAGDTVLAALSGGADSVALLLVLRELRGRLGARIVAGHVNHRLRGAESDADEEFAADLCRRLGVAFQSRRLDWSGGAPAGNMEQRLRRARYRALFEMAAGSDAAVATGHTLDDQAETFLMKLARGAGPTGLGGIFPVRRGRLRRGADTVSVKVVRPLIDCRRGEAEQYLVRRGQNWREDATNRDPALDRNWVRLQLLPLMKDRLNPKVVENIGRGARLLREIDEWLKGSAGVALRRCLTGGAGDATRLGVDRLLRLPRALAKETIWLAIRRARGSPARLSHRHVSDVYRLLTASSGKSVDLPGGWKARREFGEICLTRWFPPDFALELTIPGEIFVYQTGVRVRAERVEIPARSAAAPPPGEVRLRLAADRLTVRNRRPGDRMLLGGRWVKLKDLLQKRRIPVGRRNRLLVLESDQGVAWVEEIGVDDRCRPGPGGGRGVRVSFASETFGAGDGSKSVADEGGNRNPEGAR